MVWAMWRVARHFLCWPDLISQILLVAMVLNVVAYVPSTLADATDLNAREFAVVLPFGAVLAGPYAGGRPAGPRARTRRLARVAEMAGLRSGRRLCGQPRVRRGPAVGPRG